MAADPERLQRFQREARAVAALNHPNIVTIYSVEEADGVQFLTMELVEGKTLAEVIPDGGLPLEDLLRLAVPLVEAVAVAHEHGIVHRDLKPANVMLAKRRPAEGARLRAGEAQAGGRRRQTDETTCLRDRVADAGQHTVVGTAAYMSPEQAEGRPVDHRSDIFSLGVVLYEMASGRRPFEGDTAVSVISSIIKDTPAPLSDVKRDVPPALERIVMHALAKDPAQRYQSATRSAERPAGACSGRRQRAGSCRSLVRAVARSRWTRRLALAAGWSRSWRGPRGTWSRGRDRPGRRTPVPWLPHRPS